MANKRIKGLVAIKIGDIASDGGMGTSLTEIGDTVEDSAVLGFEKPTSTPIYIEESDDAIEIIDKAGPKTFAWETYNLTGSIMKLLFGGTFTALKQILTKGSITAGTGYSTPGTYTDVALTGGTGSGAKATIVVSGGGVTSVTITDGGSGYTAADSLTTSASNIGGGGTGFAVAVATVAAAAKWEAPAKLVAVYKSIEVTDQLGNKIEIVKAKFSPSLALNFQKSSLGKLPIECTILTPDKANTAPVTLTYA